MTPAARWRRRDKDRQRVRCSRGEVREGGREERAEGVEKNLGKKEKTQPERAI